MSPRATDLYIALRNLLLLAAVLLALLWFLFEIREVLLLFLFASSLAIIINSPVTWLEQKRVPRLVAVFLVFALILAVVLILAWVLLPPLARDLTTLILNIPSYADALRDYLVDFIAQYPGLDASLDLEQMLPRSGLSFVSLVLRPLGRYSFSLLGWAAIIIFLVSVILYMVAYPIPLLETYQRLLPPRWREPGTAAFVHASEMIVGWMRANILAGGLEAIAAALVLSLLNVPGALVWAVFTFFAELVPRLGLYLMALPPALVALSIDPLKAVWVLLFYIVMDQAMGDLILPRLQKQTMDIHPVLILFAILALAAAFGIVGALLATPIAAIGKAYYEAFYLQQRADDPNLDERVQQMLHTERVGSPTVAGEAEGDFPPDGDIT